MTGLCCDGELSGENGREQWSCRVLSLTGKGSQVTRFVLHGEVAESGWVGGGAESGFPAVKEDGELVGWFWKLCCGFTGSLSSAWTRLVFFSCVGGMFC